MPRKLSPYERETNINFNEGEDTAHIFTYNKIWQKHLEGKLGLKPVMDNRYGGKEYQISKKRIKPPRAPRKLSAEAKQKLAKQLVVARCQKSNLSPQNHTVMRKSNNKKQNKGKTIAMTV